MDFDHPVVCLARETCCLNCYDNWNDSNRIEWTEETKQNYYIYRKWKALINLGYAMRDDDEEIDLSWVTGKSPL